jgi:subtilisin family serine protease
MKHLLIILLILSGVIFSQELPKYAPGQAIVVFDQIAYTQIQNELLQESLLTSNPDANQLFSSLQATRIQNILKKDSFDAVEEETGLNRSFVIYFPAFTDAAIDEVVNTLKKSYLIEDAFPNALATKLADPNDPYYNQTAQYNLFKIKMSQAWDLKKGNTTIRIAILDWGFQPTHQELNDKIYTQKDYTDLILSNYSGWSFPNEDVVTVDDDATGLIEHGTDVAQVAAAETNNSYGIAGVGWLSPLVLVRCGFRGTNPQGSTVESAETDDVINAINWIRTSSSANVINISFGWAVSPSPLLLSAITSCINAGIVVVAAAGNTPGGSVMYPAAYPGVIAVSGTNQSDINDSYAQGPQV